MNPHPLPINSALKRLIDIAVSGAGLIVLSPVILAVGLLVRCTLGSPVFFRQQRPGLRGAPFELVKFRTMTFERAATGELVPDAARLTRSGKLLRRTSLDELPELWNVLVGDMSLVGPRPLLMEYLDRYTAEQMRRHEAKPGITGWAQVNGRNAMTWEQKFAFDVWYVDNWSVGLDLKILLMTLGTVLTGRGVSQEGSATSEPFLGR
ncbi:MAG: sugar transferase [Thermodesulfobacteriota bacterium]